MKVFPRYGYQGKYLDKYRLVLSLRDILCRPYRITQNANVRISWYCFDNNGTIK